MDRPDKRALRARLIAQRAGLDPETRSQLSRRIARELEGLPLLWKARTVALYAPLGAEVELPGLFEKLHERSIRCLYPCIRQGRRLEFSECTPDLLVRGRLGALEPPGGTPSAPSPEIVIVPGVGFSEDGFRLGRGGGFYDNTLADLPDALRVAVAYEFQVLPELPREPHDVLMDVVVTERRTLRFARAEKGETS